MELNIDVSLYAVFRLYKIINLILNCAINLVLLEKII